MRTWLISLLTLTNVAKSTYFRDLALYHPDREHTQSTNAAENPGYATRLLLTANSATVSFQCALPLSLSTSGLALPPGLDAKVVLVNNRDAQRVMCGDAALRPKIHFLSLELHVTYLGLHPPALLRVRARQNSAPLAYPFMKSTTLMPTTLPAGVAEANITVLRGQIPDLIIVALQRADYAGNNYSVCEATDLIWESVRECFPPLSF